MASTPDPLQARVIADALHALAAARAVAPTVLPALATSPAQLEALAQALTAVELPQCTPTGIPYDAPLAKAELGTRAYKVLLGRGITSVRQFCALHLSDLLQIRNLGKASLQVIEAYRAKLGVPL